MMPQLTDVDDIGDSLAAWRSAGIESICSPRLGNPHLDRTAVAQRRSLIQMKRSEIPYPF